MDIPRRLIAPPRRGAASLALGASLALVLSGCVALPALGGASPERVEPGTTEPGTPSELSDEPTDDAPRTQAESCDWEAPKLTAAASPVPQGTAGEVQAVIVGAWQHTHFDTGGGYEPVTADIRYVFPSSERILYCQHVEGVTDHAENAADITWDDTRIVLPGGVAPGWVVVAWNADTMVWLNRADDSHYLLHRR